MTGGEVLWCRDEGCVCGVRMTGGERCCSVGMRGGGGVRMTGGEVLWCRDEGGGLWCQDDGGERCCGVGMMGGRGVVVIGNYNWL